MVKKGLPLSDLTDQEASIRSLLVEASNYIRSLPNHKAPTLRFAGGWVRDKLLGKSSDDIDVAIDSLSGYNFGSLLKEYLMLPETQAHYSCNDGGGAILGALAKIDANPEKSKHLETATVKIFGLQIDLVNLRKETYVADSRNPTKLEFGTAEEDALRRDSTINALFYNIHTLEIEDFSGRGLQDLERETIKTPLPPMQTFKDDPLRVLRHIRFASRLGFAIDPCDLQAMRDPDIRAEFMRKVAMEKDENRAEKLMKVGNKKVQSKAEETMKISRERVGVEVEKMLKGPKPWIALRLVDELGLYNNIFTNPGTENNVIAEITRWHCAYDELCSISNGSSQAGFSNPDFKHLRRLLLRNPEDVYHAWLLCALVPWARAPIPEPERPFNKRPRSLAGFSARGGIKAENKILSIVEDAVHYLTEITSVISGQETPTSNTTSSSTEKEIQAAARQKTGTAIRRWGPYWRSFVIYALLVQVSENDKSEEWATIRHRYCAWLLGLESQALLEIHALKPLVNGNELCKALHMEPGPWMKPALEKIVQWQLRNPDMSDSDEAIEEIRRCEGELGIA